MRSFCSKSSQMVDDQSSNFACPLLTLPFSHISEDDFFSIINEMSMSNFQIQSDENECVFNVFDLEDNDSENPLSPFDPDNNFFCTLNNFDSLNSKYYNDVEFNLMWDKLNCVPQTMSLLHLNLRSAPKNLSNLENYLSLLSPKFQLIGLTETWLKTHNKDLYNLCGYKHESKIRDDKMGGGVSLFISELLNYVVREDLSLNNPIFESVFVKIATNDGNQTKSTIIGVIYRPLILL